MAFPTYVQGETGYYYESSMRRNKYKIISTIGIMSSILLFALDSALSLYNFGSGTTSHGTGYFERFPFSWDSISEIDWKLWGLTVGWYALLVIPWIQYFNAVRMEGRFSRTLAAMNDEPFFSAAFTVSNISLIIASTLLFIRTGEPDEKGLIENYERWWNELLMIYVFLCANIYILAALAAIIANYRKNRELRKGQYIPVDKPIPVWHWVVSAIPFLLMALSVVDARWDIFSFL